MSLSVPVKCVLDLSFLTHLEGLCFIYTVGMIFLNQSLQQEMALIYNVDNRWGSCLTSSLKETIRQDLRYEPEEVLFPAAGARWKDCAAVCVIDRIVLFFRL